MRPRVRTDGTTLFAWTVDEDTGAVTQRSVPIANIDYVTVIDFRNAQGVLKTAIGVRMVNGNLVTFQTRYAARIADEIGALIGDNS